MSLPPELRVLCDQLSSVPVVELPCLLPNLSQNILYCKEIILNSTLRSDVPGASVLIHKLKTRLTTLLNCKQPEGRFVATVLIKAFIDIGGWEAVKSSGPWARGLLAILGKPDHIISKELCVITLTKLYILIQNYPSLVREIATPTLPAYATACLNLLSPITSKKTSSVPTTLIKTIFNSFCALIPRYASIFRPFSSQIRLLICRFLAPSNSEVPYIPQTLKETARHLFIRLHETAPKNSCSEEWHKAVTDLVHNIHVTSDQVFRSIVEDWESSVGYVTEPVDINKEIQGGGDSGYLTPWKGIEAGADKLISLLEFLAMYFLVGTSGPVTVPIGIIKDMIDRILLVLPTGEDLGEEDSMQLNPGVGRDEKDALWCRIPYIHIAVLRLWLVIADRMKENFLSLAQVCFDQLVWVFPYGKHNSEFRLTTFELMSRILIISGKGLEKAQVNKASTIIKSCCDELYIDKKLLESQDENGNKITLKLNEKKNLITDLFKQQGSNLNISSQIKESEVFLAASRLLPLFLSYISQDNFNLSRRSMIDRTAILSKNREAMLASVLNPITGNCDREIPSILPYLTQAFASDNVVEILLRPRMPQLSLAEARLCHEDSQKDISMIEEMDYEHEASHLQCSMSEAEVSTKPPVTESMPDIDPPILNQASKVLDYERENNNQDALTSFSTSKISPSDIEIKGTKISSSKYEKGLEISPEESTSDDESVHLTMQLDTDSESE
ncbi:putative arm repeat-containing protein [Erysiphe neolycopersici]|uniref:Pre-rRNA-processing protein RIX1 n=1 Tax=Erysiphe neolycopersici TaxID=212602 RepID=A0A420HVH4_9PEZI|nr:putative arm repeat-containing protein [Erysiphe neolycopersici]